MHSSLELYYLFFNFDIWTAFRSSLFYFFATLLCVPNFMSEWYLENISKILANCIPLAKIRLREIISTGHES